ncbi:MAG: hypothetical protein ACFB6R_05380 [Alphaproteobacteria bacterium]
MFKSLFTVAALMLAALAVEPAFAAKAGQPQISGQTLNVGLIAENNTVALGFGANARTRAGGVQNGRFNGDLTNVGLIAQNNTVALGIGADSRSDAGMVFDARLQGSLTNVGLMSENNTIALGVATKAETAVGTTGTE